MTLSEYLNDSKTRSAVERQFEIIGEALSRIKKVNPEILNGIEDWQAIIGFRNILAHCYNTTNDEVIYGFAVEDVHTLLKDIEKKLKP